MKQIPTPEDRERASLPPEIPETYLDAVRMIVKLYSVLDEIEADCRFAQILYAANNWDPTTKGYSIQAGDTLSIIARSRL